MNFYRNNLAVGSIPQLSSMASVLFKSIVIAGATGAGINYQVPLLIGESSGSATNNFHLSNLATSFPTGKNVSGSLRFTGNGSSLSFWVENVTGTTPNRVAKVWVKVAEDLGTNKTIKCLYTGDSTNASDGDNTFLFFDDFEGTSLDTTTKWTVDNNTGLSVSGGNLTETNTSMRIRSKTTFSGGVELIIKSTTSARATNGQMLGGFYISSSNGLGILDHPGSRYIRNDSNWVQLTNELPTTTMYSRIKTYSNNTADIKMYNFSDMSLNSDWGTVTNTVSSEPITLGYRYDDQLGGQSCNTVWDYLFTKKVQATEPSFLYVEGGVFPTSNLIAYYRMEGNANDSVNSYNGTSTSMTYSTGNGKNGQGAGFDGSGYITLPTTMDTQLSNAISISIWVKKTTTTSSQYIFALNSSDNDSPEIRLFVNYSSPNMTFGWPVYDSGAYQCSIEGTIPYDNNWHHIAAVAATNNFAIYIDSVLKATDTSGSFNIDSIGELRLGYYSRSGNKFAGSADEFAIWAGTLTQDDVNTIYSGGVGVYY